MTIWQTLGVDQAVSVTDLRRRYATLIKEFRPETHPQDFARIREAYEVALPWARRREAERLEVAEIDEIDEIEDPYPPADLDDASESLSVEDELGIHAAALSVVLGEPQAEVPDDEPRLAAQFRRFHALAEAAVGTRDEAFLPELRALLQARAGASLDDSQALEFALMRWFIEAENPPLTLLFEAGRTFDWHTHAERLSGWLSPWALRQMEARLSLSRDLVWARHFSGNAWLRRLHSPLDSMTLLASRPATVEALRWVDRWCHGCAKAEAPVLLEALNGRVLRRLQGQEFMSTDLLTGLALALAADGLADALLYAVIGAAVALALRLGLRWIHPAPGKFRLPGPVGRALASHGGWAILFAAGLAGVGFVMLTRDEMGGDSRAVALPLIVPAALVGVLAIWRVLAWLELAAVEPFSWRDAVDRLEFDACLRRRTATDAARPYGERLTTRQRWRAIPAALRLRRIELATQARPARPPVLRWFRLTLARPGKARLIWIGLWVLFAILRALHGFGH